MRELIIALFLLVLSLPAWTDTCTCGLPGSPVSFRDCQKRPAEWKSHDDSDVGLTGSCLPQIPANTMKCFKWRMAGECPGHHLRCSLKSRSIKIEKEVKVTPNLQSATFFSPSFRNQTFYRNNNFCIYNISLNCPGKVVNLASKLADGILEDGDLCEDYLWFSTSFYGHPHRLCGNMTTNFTDTLHTQSFIAVLWTNDANSEGKFEIEARCSESSIPAIVTESLGENPILSNA